MLTTPQQDLAFSRLHETLQRELPRVQAGLLTEQQLLASLTQQLTEAAEGDPQLLEGFVSGLAGLVAPGSTLRNAAQSVGQKIQQTGQQVLAKGQQVVQQVRNDHRAASAAGDLKKLAIARSKAEENLAGELAAYRQKVQEIQAARLKLRREHKAQMREFHRQAHDLYLRAGQALGIPVSKGDAFYDAVDQALDQRRLIPQVLREADQGLQFPD
jgi:hypothetical protein